MALLKLAGGRVIDPARRVDAVADLWIEAGKIVAPPGDRERRPDRTIDVRGDVVMPAGVDVHCHIAGSKVNGARALRPEEARREGGSLPTTGATGLRYAGLGYATAVDAAIAPLMARQAHLEMADTPIIDKAFLLLMGNNHYVMDRIREGDSARLRAYLAWAVATTRAFGIKVVNPGGVERWKQGDSRLATLDDDIPGFGVTPRSILTSLADAAEGLGLPHPVHVHGLNLGVPGNAADTEDLIRALDGRRAHLAHVQFHSYGGDPGDLGRMTSEAGRLADAINARDGLSVDVGQVMFGETTSMTADSAVASLLHRVAGRKWLGHDVEAETGCGVVPIRYEDTNAVHALQWAIGLEWFLRVDDPWKVALSTDHPNGGSFLSYPAIIALLMDRTLRADALARLPESVKARCPLGDLPREYTLSEIAIITRAGPARMLGLADKGHLGVGADADVTVYRPDSDRARMFATPRYLLKAGEVILDDGEVRATPAGSLLHAEPARDREAEADIAAWTDRHLSVRFANLAVEDALIGNPRRVDRVDV